MTRAKIEISFKNEASITTRDAEYEIKDGLLHVYREKGTDQLKKFDDYYSVSDIKEIHITD